jgi:DNA ligase 1
MLLSDLVAVSNTVASTPARSEKIAVLAETLRRLGRDEAAVAVSYLTGKPTQRRLGVGYSTLNGLGSPPAAAPILEILEVDRVLEDVAGTSGAGSKERREVLLEGLWSRATSDEQEFLAGLILRNLRQGALEGVMADAVALALDVPTARVRRAAMLEGDLVAVATRALAEGAASLGRSSLAVFTPVQPMLAKTAESAESAVAEMGEAVVEQKLDGLRVQVHRAGSRVTVFSRNLRDISAEVPGVVQAAFDYAADRFILDGEALLIDPEGRPMAFQDSMSRGEGAGAALSAFYFDLLHHDGTDYIDEPLAVRRESLAKILPETAQVRAVVTADPDEAGRFFTHTVESGYEGVVVKDLTQSYEAGRRGSGWLKVKPTHTLDLVVLAAEWGSGRRQGWLSNLHLGARGPDGEPVMLGKTFKGLTDEMLEWQTREFFEIETRRQGHIVFLEPRIVYEIAFDGVQRSTRYPGGVTLRFARVKRYRDDKGPEEADTLETVRSFLR